MGVMRSRQSNIRPHSAGGAARTRNRRVGCERLHHRWCCHGRRCQPLGRSGEGKRRCRPGGRRVRRR
eukprot:1762573-Pleurochrysis_carterae.AAC.3